MKRYWERRRDSQRSKVYKAEYGAGHCVGGSPGESIKWHTENQRVFRQLGGKFGIDRFALQRNTKVMIRRGPQDDDGGSFTARIPGRSHRILLGKVAPFWVYLHELAHDIHEWVETEAIKAWKVRSGLDPRTVPHQQALDDPWHGPEFAGIHLQVVLTVLGEDARLTLSRAYLAHKVKVQHWAGFDDYAKRRRYVKRAPVVDTE